VTPTLIFSLSRQQPSLAHRSLSAELAGRNPLATTRLSLLSDFLSTEAIRCSPLSPHYKSTTSNSSLIHPWGSGVFCGELTRATARDSCGKHSSRAAALGRGRALGWLLRDPRCQRNCRSLLVSRAEKQSRRRIGGRGESPAYLRGASGNFRVANRLRRFWATVGVLFFSIFP
jgi:hypothetical protein